jgi:RNA polymerase sigma factor (sigma-70 family)
MSLVSGVSQQERNRRALAGNAEAFGAVYAELAPQVQRFLLGLRLGLGQQSVEDAVQETFLRLLRDRDRVDPTRPLRPFVLGIARNVGLKLCSRRPLGDSEAHPEPVVVTPDGAALREEQAIVQEAVSALAPEHRAALSLRHLGELSMRELAQALDCSVPTARARLREAAQLLALELRRRGVEGGDS